LRGKEYRTKTDAEGKGLLTYDVETAGLNPSAELSLVLGSGQPLLLPKKKVLISASRMRLDIDINSFYPDWDKNIDMLMERARRLIAEEEWEDARTSLKQVLDRRPGQGSAETYILMGQAWIEHRKKYYPQALDALRRASSLRKGLTGPTSTRLLEKLSYYLIIAGFEEYDDLDSDNPKRNELARALRDQCTKYEQFSKGETRKRLDASEYNQHVEKVTRILLELRK
jgi:tetratricopeptide (TPR) repeat protein